jgi:hypothetical protein
MRNSQGSRQIINAKDSNLKNVLQISAEGDVLLVQLSPSSIPIRITSKKREEVLKNYRNWICEMYSKIPTVGIPLPRLDIHRHLVNIELDEIFIKLRIIPPQNIDENLTIKSRKQTEAEILSNIVRSLQKQETQNQNSKEISSFEESNEYLTPIDPETAITEFRHLVLIGGPGSGKSTLLRHICWKSAKSQRDHPLSLLISLGKLDIRMAETGLSFFEALLDILAEHEVENNKTIHQAVLLWLIKQKQVRFLFDGLDEAHVKVAEIRDGIESLRADGQKILVTSRPIGYYPLGGFDLFEVLPLLSNDANVFAGKWFKALAKTKKNLVYSHDKWISQRTSWLQDQLDKRPSLKDLSLNPLFLTFLVILAGEDPQVELPRKRIDLYNSYLEKLITSWETLHKRRSKLVFGSLTGEEASNFAQWGLCFVALEVQKAFYGNEQYYLPSRSEITKTLSVAISSRWNIRIEIAGNLAAKLIKFWHDAGIIEGYRIGEIEWLSFRHLTFQEYGAAKMLEILYQGSPKKLWWLYLRHYVRDPQWAEVIPQAIAHFPEEDATYLLQRLILWDITKPIASYKSDPFFISHERNTAYPLLIAARALTDGASAPRDLRLQIILRLYSSLEPQNDLLWERRFARSDEIPPWDAVAETLARFEPGSEEIIELIKQSNSITLSPQSLINIAKVFSRIGEKRVAANLLRRAVGDIETSSHQKIDAISILFEIGEATESLDRLREIVQDPGASIIDQVRAAEVMIRLGNIEEGVSLLNKYSSTPSVVDENKLEIAKILTQYGYEESGKTLILEISNRRIGEIKTRIRGAEALRKLGDSKSAQNILESIAYDRMQMPNNRREAVSTLFRNYHNKESLSVLAEFAKDNVVPVSIRGDTIEDLITIGQYGLAKEILDELDIYACQPLERIQIGNLFFRLGIEEKGIEIAENILRSPNVDFRTKLKAVEILSKTTAKSAAIVWLIDQVKNSATDSNTRWAIARVAMNLGWQNIISDTLQELFGISKEGLPSDLANLIKMAKDNDLLTLLNREEIGYSLQLVIIYLLIRRGTVRNIQDMLQQYIRNEKIPDLYRIDAAELLFHSGDCDSPVNLARDLLSTPSTSVEVKRRAATMLFAEGMIELYLNNTLSLCEQKDIQQSDRLQLIDNLFIFGYIEYGIRELLKAIEPSEQFLVLSIEKLFLFGNKSQIITVLDKIIEELLTKGEKNRKISLYWQAIGIYSMLVEKFELGELLKQQLTRAKDLSFHCTCPKIFVRLGYKNLAKEFYSTIARETSNYYESKQALEALIKLGFISETKQILSELSVMQNLDESFMNQVAFMLAELGEIDRAVNILIELLHVSKKGDTRRKSIDSLRLFGRLDDLLFLSKDSSLPPQDRFYIADALIDLDRLSFAENIITQIGQDQTTPENIRYEAAKNLAKIGATEKAIGLLLDIIKAAELTQFNSLQSYKKEQEKIRDYLALINQT